MRKILLILCLFTSACVSFAPNFSEDIFSSLKKGNEELEKIETAVAVPYTPSPSYKDLEQNYISAIASFERAKRIADQRPPYYDRMPAAESSQLVASAIENCLTAVRLQMEQHQAGSLSRELGEVSPVLGTCSIPQTMETLLKD